MAAGGGELLCVSGAALGAVLASLFLDRRAPAEDDMAQDQMRMMRQMMQQQMQQQFQAHLGSQTKDLSAAMGFGHSQEDKDVHAQIAHKNLNLDVPQWEGFSMADARKRSEHSKQTFKELAPEEVLSKLQRGNARFWTGNAVRPEKSAFERRALIMAQYPCSAILGCSDSRVPAEVVFDQGLGDMFVVRVAGNVLDMSTKASLQYSVHHLKVKVLLVMGHEGCGAVKAAGLPISKIEQEPEELASALKLMKAGLNEHRLQNVHDARAYDREAVVTNVRRQVEGLCDDPLIMAKVQAKELIIVGCFYEISSGIVDFFMEVTEAPGGEPALVMKGKTSGVQSRLEYSKDTSAGALRSKSGFKLPQPHDTPVK